MPRYSTRVQDPSVEPVSLAEMKQHLRIGDDTGDDDYIESLISSARSHIEAEIGIALIEQKWALVLDCPPVVRSNEWWDGVRELPISFGRTSSIELPVYPLISVDSVVYYTELSDDPVSWSTSNLIVDTGRRPGIASLRTGAVWPSSIRPTSGLKFTYTAGFGSASGDVPNQLRHAVRMIAADWYENRETVSLDAVSSGIEISLGRILDQYRVRKI